MSLIGRKSIVISAAFLINILTRLICSDAIYAVLGSYTAQGRIFLAVCAFSFWLF